MFFAAEEQKYDRSGERAGCCGKITIRNRFARKQKWTQAGGEQNADDSMEQFSGNIVPGTETLCYGNGLQPDTYAPESENTGAEDEPDGAGFHIRNDAAAVCELQKADQKSSAYFRNHPEKPS